MIKVFFCLSFEDFNFSKFLLDSLCSLIISQSYNSYQNVFSDNLLSLTNLEVGCISFKPVRNTVTPEHISRGVKGLIY